MSRSLRTPKYRLHERPGQAVVTPYRREIYLGRHGTEESKAESRRLIAEWMIDGGEIAAATSGTADLTTNEQAL